jgi:DUF2075 family protein
MKIQKYFPLLLSTVCVYSSIVNMPVFQADKNLSASAFSIIENRVNGYSVKEVHYGSKNGFFQQQADGSWIEKNDDGEFRFREVGRDEWSVYLLKSDGLPIQLDLHRKEVIWRGQGKLYDIKKASSTITVNGYNVKSVGYKQNGNGIFYEFNGTWYETNKDGTFTFREVDRDEWSVYLVKSDGLRIQLDLHRKEVIWMGQGKLYDINYISDQQTTF